MQPELYTRQGELEPTTIDEAARTVEVVWSTGAAVRRRDAAGVFDEVLSLDPQHVDLAELVGAPLLDHHRQTSVADVLGVVLEAHVDGTRGTALLKFSERAAAVWADVKAGILRAVSVGYSVARWAESTVQGTRVKTATRWTPRELSLVAIAADAGASVRKETTMDDDTDTGDALAQRAATNTEIRALVKAAGLEVAAADALIDRQASLEQARAELSDQLVQRTTHVQHQRVDVGTNHDAPEERLTRMTDALESRMTGKAPTDAGREYMHRRLVDLAGELLELRGVRGVRQMSPDTIFQRAMHTTSDFPTLLTGTGNRVLLAAFEAAPNPLKTLARQTTVADFRTKTVVKLSEWPRLELVGEGGEVHQGTRAEAKEAYALKSYAKIFSLSRQALLNDDLNAWADFGRAAGRAAAETEGQLLVDLFTSNAGVGPTLDDGSALFHANHGNLAGAGTVIDVTNLAAARLAMRSQKGLDGLTPVNATPAYLLVSATKETQGESVLASLAPAAVSNVNPFSGKLTLLVEPRLSGNPWYVFADPAVLPVLEYSYLSGAPGPQMTSREGFEVLGIEFRVLEDYGCGVIDYRGVYRNPGA
jgi:hypothetical protein